jgi:hypothetical protein
MPASAARPLEVFSCAILKGFDQKFKKKPKKKLW